MSSYEIKSAQQGDEFAYKLIRWDATTQWTEHTPEYRASVMIKSNDRKTVERKLRYYAKRFDLALENLCDKLWRASINTKEQKCTILTF